MHMEAEVLISNIRKKLSEIDTNRTQVEQMLNELSHLPAEEWDWISVAHASKETGISVSTLYNKINNGSLECKKIESKRLVRMSDIMAIND